MQFVYFSGDGRIVSSADYSSALSRLFVVPSRSYYIVVGVGPIRKLETYITIAKIAHPAVQVSGLADGRRGVPLRRVVEVRLAKGLLPVR